METKRQEAEKYIRGETGEKLEKEEGKVTF